MSSSFISKYKPYPSYKNSGIEWLGDIPQHWGVKRLKFFAKICNGCDHKDVWDVNGQYPIIGSGGIFGYANQYLYNKPSVLLGRKGTIDKPQFIDFPFWSVDTAYYTDIYSTSDKKFFYYLCLTIDFDEYKYGSAVPSMTQGTLNQIIFCNPPLNEQKAIALYLDSQTTKIDKLIAKKERFIELLQEKRTALISHTVTKGLNPDVPMKDSGIEWLGDIPEHWETVPLRAVLKERLEYNNGRKTENILSVLKNIGVVNYEDREASGNKKSENIEQYKIVYPRDIVVNRMNLIFGSVGISEYHGATSTEYYVVKPKHKEISPEYFAYIFCNSSFQKSLVGIGKGILFHRMRIYYEEFKKIPLPYPPLIEQKEIASYLDTQTTKIDILIDKTKESIEKLKEYRTALISAVVTGKIDVRGEKN